MTWTNRAPASNIPARIKRDVRQRQHEQCATIAPKVCTGAIDEFDHIINVKTLGIDRAEANDPNNIQGLCRPCHKVKTQQESLAARNRGRRTPTPHIGLA